MAPGLAYAFAYYEAAMGRLVPDFQLAKESPMSLDISKPAPAGVLLDTAIPYHLYHSWFIGHRGILTIIPDPQYLARAATKTGMANRIEALTKQVFLDIEKYFEGTPHESRWFSLLTGVFFMHRLGNDCDKVFAQGFSQYLEQSPYHQPHTAWYWRQPYDNNQGVTGWFETHTPTYQLTNFKAQVSHTPERPAFYEAIAQLPDPEGSSDINKNAQVYAKLTYWPWDKPQPHVSGQLPAPAGPFQLLVYLELIHYPAYPHVWETPNISTQVLIAHIHQALMALANRALPTFDKKHYFPPEHFQGLKLNFPPELVHLSKLYEASDSFKAISALFKAKTISHQQA